MPYHSLPVSPKSLSLMSWIKTILLENLCNTSKSSSLYWVEVNNEQKVILHKWLESQVFVRTKVVALGFAFIIFQKLNDWLQSPFCKTLIIAMYCELTWEKSSSLLSSSSPSFGKWWKEPESVPGVRCPDMKSKLKRRSRWSSWLLWWPVITLDFSRILLFSWLESSLITLPKRAKKSKLLHHRQRISKQVLSSSFSFFLLYTSSVTRVYHWLRHQILVEEEDESNPKSIEL